MHIVLNVLDKVKQLGVILHTHFINQLFKMPEKLYVASCNDDKLHIFTFFGKPFVKFKHACNAERACHQEHRRNIGVKSLPSAYFFLVKRLCKAVKNRNTKRIDYAFVNAVFVNKLFCHLRLCKHICLNFRNNICTVGVIVGNYADCFYINLTLSAKL